MTKIDQRIQAQIELYKEVYMSNSIDDILTIQDRLSMLTWELSEEYHKEYNEYVGMYGQYKTQRAKQWLKLKHGAINMTNGEIDKQIEGNDSIQANYLDRLFSEGRIETIKMKMQSLSKLLSSIQQRVSYLKKEKEQAT